MADSSFPTGIRVFIDEEDVTSFLFGEDTVTLTDIHRIFNNLDITSYLKYVGTHTLKITAEGGIGRVDARITIH